MIPFPNRTEKRMAFLSRKIASKVPLKTLQIWQLAVKRVLVLIQVGGFADGAADAARHPRAAARGRRDKHTPILDKTPHKLPLPDKTRRGRASVAAEPLGDSPRFRPLFRFSFQVPMVFIIGNIYGACTR